MVFSPSAVMNIARRYVVSGLVQGVGFRYWALKRAQEHGIVGYVQNLPDGRVVLIAEGTEEALDALRGELSVGPSFSSVSRVEEFALEPTARYERFSIAR
jgi:acylphosphatase